MSIADFVVRQRQYFLSLKIPGQWEDSHWDACPWLEVRGIKTRQFPFTVLGTSTPLPHHFSDFAKAMLLAIYQLKRPKFSALVAYLLGIRRLYDTLSTTDCTDPIGLTNGHFHNVVETLKRQNYKNLYDAANCLEVLGKAIDKYKLTSVPIGFVCQVQPPVPRMRHDPTTEREALPSKLPSREAMVAYAQCTNNPINDREEILLRIVDLHIALGARINESLLIPFDCWVEREVRDDQNLVIPEEGECASYIECGIRYYPEKGFEPSIHWLADSDVPLAKRAVDRLTFLTRKVRETAIWQHENPGRLWDISPQTIVSRSFIHQFIGASQAYNLDRNLKSLGIIPVRAVRGNSEYLAGDIERAFLPKRPTQVALQKEGRVFLALHECLCIAFSGYFRFKEREESVNHLLPRLVSFSDIAGALGNTIAQSIFDRRNLTEADGSRISLRTHQSRHWRNTLYKLGGMTEIQQALAMGRKDVRQNSFYQHVAVDSELAFHSAFVEFQSYHEKVKYLQAGIIDGKIRGALADTYHELASRDPVNALEFLETHAGGVHVTLWGICTNDFSREPCSKHLQCFDNCGHLHRTNDAREAANLEKLLLLNLQVLEKMEDESASEAGADKWVEEQKRKIAGIRKAIALGDRVMKTISIQVFPGARGVTAPAKNSRGSSV
ncbi:hypothetical protein [Herbaspirillum seropedicae]|uniref:hypothetical protein n=1 Tax=Herbaspirillum seropedicae TaxID=964 RepID=UPI003D96ED4D